MHISFLPPEMTDSFRKNTDGQCDCVSVYYGGGGGGVLAAHFINILQKKKILQISKTTFQFWPGNLCLKKTEANKALMQLHVLGFNYENMLKWHTYRFRKAYTRIHHLCLHVHIKYEQNWVHTNQISCSPSQHNHQSFQDISSLEFRIT